jgi:predicted aminopeptidase
VSIAGCSPAYVLRAGYEEAKILWRRQPIEEMLRRTDLEESVRDKLGLVLRARAFAEDVLQLRVGGSYETYAHVDADQIVHVVTAAERLRLEAYTWWFPVVGRVPYKGFFSPGDALAEAAALEQAGLDVYLRTSAAFSTLGWFDDPLLSTVLRRDRVDVVATVFHELLHNTSYIGGRSFDESFASFVGQRAAIAFFEAQGDGAAAAAARERWADALQFSAFLAGVVAELQRAYASGVTLDERERLFAETQARFRTLLFRTDRYAGYASTRLNNAVILHEQLYFDRLTWFEEILRGQDGDLPRTIRLVIDAGATNADDPYAGVSRLLPPHTAGRPLVPGD